MIKFLVPTITIYFCLTSLPVQAESSKACRKAYVTGTIQTTTINETMQVGTTELLLTDHKGHELFDEQGGIIGRLKSFDPNTGQSILDHSLFFADGSRVETENDVAQAIGLCPDGRLHIIEKISTFAWGSRFFKRAYIPDGGGVISEGCVNPTAGGVNEFNVSGTICIK